MADIFKDTSVAAALPRRSADGQVSGLEAAAEITSRWDYIGPNGGYLAGLAWRAIVQVVEPDMTPLSFSCQYLGPATPGEAKVSVEIAARSKRSLVCKADLSAGGQLVLSALARFVRSRDGLEFADPGAMPPPAPGPERLRPLHEVRPSAAAVPFMQNLDLRVVTDEAEWPIQRPLRPHFAAWVRFKSQASHEDGLVDAVRALVLADAFIWPAAVRPYGHQPTHAARSVDLAVSFIEPDDMTPWLLCETTALGARSGPVWGSSRVWSRQGRLVAAGLSNMYCTFRVDGHSND
jgi:acyl-CoA thioesterase